MTLFDKIYNIIGKVDCEGVNISYGRIGNDYVGEEGTIKASYLVNNEGELTIHKTEEEAKKHFRKILQKIMEENFRKEDELPW